MPDWDAQVIRVRIPCRGNINFEWRRSGLVVSLGELMQALGKDFTAKQVYYFYHTLRIVAMKRQKCRRRQACQRAASRRLSCGAP